MSKPPRETLFHIDVAKECFEVAKGDVDRAATLFRQIYPDGDLLNVTLEYLSMLARKKMKLGVDFKSHLNLHEPALRTKLRARVNEILQENKPKGFEHYEGEIELAGVVHRFSLVFDGYDTRLFVLEGSYDDFDALHDAISSVLDEPRRARCGYFDEVDQISP